MALTHKISLDDMWYTYYLRYISCSKMYKYHVTTLVASMSSIVHTQHVLVINMSCYLFISLCIHILDLLIFRSRSHANACPKQRWFWNVYNSLCPHSRAYFALQLQQYTMFLVDKNSQKVHLALFVRCCYMWIQQQLCKHRKHDYSHMIIIIHIITEHWSKYCGSISLTVS